MMLVDTPAAQEAAAVAAVTVPTEPGTPFEGGYYAGLIAIGDGLYALIASPLQGDLVGAWHPTRAVVPGAMSSCDGLANTIAMVEAGSSLAQSIRALQINGHADWYIPSRDELELLYRNLKPSAETNCCSFRDGDNPSSRPPGYPYTEETPAQTAAAAFREFGPEALATSWYWSSTQYSPNLAWSQDFDDGYQSYDTKSFEGRARAVRRFKVQ